MENREISWKLIFWWNKMFWAWAGLGSRRIFMNWGNDYEKFTTTIFGPPTWRDNSHDLLPLSWNILWQHLIYCCMYRGAQEAIACTLIIYAPWKAETSTFLILTPVFLLVKLLLTSTTKCVKNKFNPRLNQISTRCSSSE